jgi:hypothetical protein
MVVLSAVLLSSCASSAWVKEGVTEQTRNADRADCLQRAQREARDLAWEHRFEAWWPYSPDGYYDYPDRYWPYAWQGYYGPLFYPGSGIDNDTYRLTNFCMRSKGYTLAEIGKKNQDAD